MDLFWVLIFFISSTCKNVESNILSTRTNAEQISGLSTNTSIDLDVGGIVGLGVNFKMEEYYSFLDIPYAKPPVENLQSEFQCNNVESIIVRTNEGRIRGLISNISIDGILGSDSTMEKYYSFLGIPYAEPPVGDLRFKATTRHRPWKGVKKATKHGSVCPQYLSNDENTIPFTNEDCLFLNVFTKNINKKPNILLPVLVAIHGGAFEYGSGNRDVFGPKYIIGKDVILVTINYRLGSLGFLNLGIQEVPGNAGMKDQQLALEWVRDNIHHFGGDPNQVTILGQSAGSASVIYHMMSPTSKGLFNRAIAMSGVPYCEWALTYYLKDRSYQLVKDLGKDTNDPYEMLDYLKSVPTKDLLKRFPIVIPEERNWNFDDFKMTAFQPCPEEDYGQKRFLVESATETLKRGNLTQVDLLIGYTSMEGLVKLPKILTTNMTERYNDMPELLIPRDVLLGPGPVDRPALANRIKQQYFGNRPINSESIAQLVMYLSEEVFVYNINKFVRYLDANAEGLKKYLYKFSIVTSRNRYNVLARPYGIHGVAHTDDLLYLFEPTLPTGDELVDITNRVQIFIDRVVTLFTNFAKYGNPTPDDSLGVIWGEYNNESKTYLNINKTLILGNNPDVDVNAFWTSIYEDGNAELP